MLLLCALRGSIIIYQGEELGLAQVDVPFDRLQDPEAIANWPETLSRDGARTPMPWAADAPHLGFSTGEPWLPIGESHRALAVEGQEGRADSNLQFARECVRLRNSHPALRLGSMRIVEADEQKVAFERAHGAERLRCTFNLSDRPLSLRLGGKALATVGAVGSDTLGPFGAAIEAVK
jgi:alpha-glucosidase